MTRREYRNERKEKKKTAGEREMVEDAVSEKELKRIKEKKKK